MRRDLQIIVDTIKPNSRVLDLGCGDGLLLKELTEKKKVNGFGIEISLAKIKECLNNGISVIQEDLNEGLKDFHTKTFDYVILSQTLEYIANPFYLIQEMLRVGKKCIISFENLAYWKNRFLFLFEGTLKRGRTTTPDLFYGKKIQILTIHKFFTFCEFSKIKIFNQYYLPERILTRSFPNIFSKIAIFILGGEN